MYAQTWFTQIHVSLRQGTQTRNDPPLERTLQAAGKKRDDKAIAWYNLACVASLAGRPDAAARALKMCLEALSKPSEKVSWMQEALQDVDLQPVMNTPDMQAVQALLPQKKATPKKQKPLGGYAPKRRVIQGGGCRVWLPDAFHLK